MFSSSSNRFPTPRLCAYHPNSLAASAIATVHFFFLRSIALPRFTYAFAAVHASVAGPSVHAALSAAVVAASLASHVVSPRAFAAASPAGAFASPISSPRTPRPAPRRAARTAPASFASAPSFLSRTVDEFDSTRRVVALVRRRATSIAATRIARVRARAIERVDVVDRRGVRIVTL